MRRHGWQRRVQYPLEAAAAYAIYGVVAALPLAAASALGGFLGRGLGPRLGVSRRAVRNLERAFPRMTPDEIARTVRGMWDNLGRTIAEYPHLAQLWESDIAEKALAIDHDALLRRGEGATPAVISVGRIEAVGVENIMRMVDHKGPQILFSAHLGNWEVLPRWAANLGMEVAVVYRTPNNPYIATLIERLRRGAGPLLPKGLQGAVASVKVLEEGGRLGMLVDQKQNRGIAVPFFGTPVMTAPTLAKLALRFRCPVHGAWVERLDGGRFRVTVTPPLSLPESGDDNADVRAIMTEVNAILEGWIRSRPDQWFWLHRRWPEGDGTEG